MIQSSSGAIVEAAAITANRALISDANGIPTHSTVTNTELGYVSGATSSIQTQINAKFTTPTGWTDYFSSSTIVGTTSTTGVINYIVMGKLLFLQVNLAGTSSTNSWSFTLPYTIINSAQFSYGRGTTNTTTQIGIGMYIAPSTNKVILLESGANITSQTWQTTGTRTLNGNMILNIQ